MSEIRRWLERLGLGQYADAFVDGAIGIELLPELDHDVLKDLGVSVPGHRLSILKAARGGSPGMLPTAADPTKVAETDRAADARITSDAERRQLTVMFCDLVGSTTLSEKLDPEDLREVMRAYQDACAGAIGRFEGHIAQTLGDGLMVYFGYPVAHEDDAQRAVRAGLDIVRALKELSARLEESQGVVVRARVGIHTGLVVAGEVGGADTRGGMAVVGETPNIAARIEQAAMPGTVVVGERTRRLVGDVFDFEDLGAHDLKGLSVPMDLFRAKAERGADSRFEAMHPAGLTPFVGRDEEIGLLLGRWKLAKGGEGQVVLLEGEPGIGKSRITKTLRELIAQEPHTRLQYQCSPFYTNSAFHPFIAQLGRAAGFESDDSEDAKLDKLEALIGTDKQIDCALIANLLSLPMARYPALNLTPEKQKERTIEVLLGYVGKLAKEKPILLVFEDVHWIDPSSLEALDQLIGAIGAQAVLAVITFRPEFKSPWGAHSHVTLHSLNRLGKRQSALLVDQVTGKPLPRVLVDQIIVKTDGVPLFIEELTKAVVESDIVRDAGDRYELTGAVDSLAIPDTLHDSLMARLDKLIPVKEVAQVGAAIGREFSHQLVALLSPMSRSDLNNALDKLVASELVFRRGTPPEATYIFKHALVQDAAYNSMLKRDRQTIHKQIAEALETHFPQEAKDSPELIAHHYTEAGLWDKAIPAWHQAGQGAFLASAYAESIANATKGIDLLKHIQDESARATVELRLQTVLGMSYQNTLGFAAPQASKALQRAEELLDHASSTAEAVSLLAVTAIRNWAADSLPLAAKYYERAWKVAVDAGEMDMAVPCRGMQGAALFHTGHGRFGIKLLEEAMAAYDRARHRELALQLLGFDVEATIMEWLGLTYAALGYFDKGRAAQQKALEIAQRGGHPFTVGQESAWYAYGLYSLRDHKTAWDVAEAACSYCEEQNVPFWLHISLITRGYERIVNRSEKPGLDDIHKALTFLTAVGADFVASWARIVLADAHLVLGDLDATERIIAEVKPNISRGFGESALPMVLRIEAQADILRHQAKASKAEGLLLNSLEIAREQQYRMDELRTALALARLWSLKGERKQAIDLLAPVYDWFTEGFDTMDLKEAKTLLDEIRA